MSDILHAVATFSNIEPSRLNEFKKVAAQAIEIAKGEEGTLRYDFYMSGDEVACVVLETYASSEALLAHMAGMGDVVPRLVELGGDLNVEVFGSPSPALLEATAAFKPRIHTWLGGK